MPRLCSQFSWEDWILLSLRVELYLMVHSFRKDCTDPDRPGIHVDNVPFYYNRYFRKTFAANHYGFEANEKVIDLVKDTVSLGERNMLTPELGEELDNFDLFLKLTEEGRRERDLNIDLGEDEAILKFNQAVLMSQLPIPGGSQNNKGYQKGKEKGYQDQKGGKGKPGGWPMQGYDGKGFGWGGGGKGCMGPMGQMGPGGGGCKGGMPPLSLQSRRSAAFRKAATMAAAAEQPAPPPPPPPPPAEPAAPAAAPVEPAAPAAPAAPAPAEPALPAAPAAPAAPAEPEEPKELEGNAADITGPALTSQVGFNAEDTTLNVLPSSSGNSLMLLTDNGMQYLLAGARANVGVKAGRYFLDLQVVELLDPQEGHHHGRVVQPRQLLRLGFSTSKSSLLLGESEDSVCFDSEGFFTQCKTSVQATQRFDRHQVLGLLLNLDASSPNANTVSLFHDGIRVSQPIPLPEVLKGKTLFPAVTFRNITLAFNFGPVPMMPLPFKCHMLGAAATQDVEVAAPTQPKDGKFEVVFPILLPDEGSFDWVDLFLQQHPEFTELSDRMVLEWCEKSGIPRNHGYAWRTSNDKPDMQMNVPELDGLCIQHVLRSIASAHRRNFLLVELKSNLLPAERKDLLDGFRAPHFKRLAQVMVGDPTAQFKMRMQELILKEKQDKVNIEFEQQKAEKSRKRSLELQEKEVQRAAKKARIEAAEAARKAEVERRAAAGEDPLPDDAMKPEEEPDEEPDKPMPDPMEEGR
eukprot:s460_g6.t1